MSAKLARNAGANGGRRITRVASVTLGVPLAPFAGGFARFKDAGLRMPAEDGAERRHPAG